MSRKINALSVLFAVISLVIAASSAMAQREQIQKAPGIRDDIRVAAPTLACCQCLGGSNTLDLSTIPSNNWTVNGSPVALLTAIHQLWNINPGPAKWVSTVATGGTGSVNAGTYDYKLNFVVPTCVIEQRVTLSGNYGGDDDVSIFLDNPSNLIGQCTGGWCFNTPKKTLQTFTTGVGPGSHTLLVRVVNGGGPSGMFINAKLTSACRN